MEDIRVELGGNLVLDGVSASFDGPGVSAIIGPSGCGKSTMLRTILGLVPIARGRVLVDGETLPEGNALLRMRRRFGYVIQSGGLFPHLTGGANVLLPARHAGMARGAARSRLDDLASLVRLGGDELGRYPGELSGGQRQRVALMRALMLEPEALLLDEPLGALDPEIRVGLQEDLAGIFSKTGARVLLVTHDLAEAAFLAADDALLLREGTVEQRGPMRELVREPRTGFAREFVEAQLGRSRELVGLGARA
ncbi:MAG: ATP-binding cassette domain-containing protein [Planctomycetota bacterium]